MKRSFRLTEEQLRVATVLREDNGQHSFRLCCHAGTGKTTAVLGYVLQGHLTKAHHVLWLAYSVALKQDTERVVEELFDARSLCPMSGGSSAKDPSLESPRLTVATLDALLRQYDSQAPSDFEVVLDRVLRTKTARLPQASLLRSVDTIVIDEAQDLTEKYVQLIHMLVADIHQGFACNEEDAVAKHGQSTRPLQLLLVGDPRQTIFRYRQANSRFFLDTQGAFWGPPHFCPMSAQTLELCVSQRLNQDVVTLVNDVFEKTTPPLLLADEWGRQVESFEVKTEVKTDVKTASDQHSPRVASTASLESAARWITKEYAKLAMMVNTTEPTKQRSLALLSSSRKPTQAVWMLARRLRCPPYSLPSLWMEKTAPSLETHLHFWTVSTVHGAKGRTFDVVVLLVEDSGVWRRNGLLDGYLIYVGLTRASQSMLLLDARDFGRAEMTSTFRRSPSASSTPLAPPVQLCLESAVKLCEDESEEVLDPDNPQSGMRVYTSKRKVQGVKWPTQVRTWEDQFQDHLGAVAELTLTSARFEWSTPGRKFSKPLTSEALRPRIEILQKLREMDLECLNAAIHLYLRTSIFDPHPPTNQATTQPQLEVAVAWARSWPRTADLRGAFVEAGFPFPPEVSQNLCIDDDPVFKERYETWTWRHWLQLAACFPERHFGLFGDSLQWDLMRTTLEYMCHDGVFDALALPSLGCHAQLWGLPFSREPLYGLRTSSEEETDGTSGKTLVLLRLSATAMPRDLPLCPDRGLRGVACLLYATKAMTLDVWSWPYYGRVQVQATAEANAAIQRVAFESTLKTQMTQKTQKTQNTKRVAGWTETQANMQAKTQVNGSPQHARGTGDAQMSKRPCLTTTSSPATGAE